jgi:hypothetical protein
MGEGRQATDQGVLTVVTRVRPGHEAALRAILEAIAEALPPQAPVAGDGVIPFTKLATVHFARWVILPPGRDAVGKPIATELVMATAYDGPLDGHLRELATVAHEGLDAIYAHCDGWGEADVEAYLRRHAVAPAAFFVGARWRTVAQIRGEIGVRDVLETALDAPGPASNGTATSGGNRDALRAAVARASGLRWALEPPPEPTWAWWLRHYALLVVIVVGLLVLLPILLPLVVIGLVLVRRAERRDAARDPTDPAGDDVAAELRRLRELTQVEDFQTQNQMTLVSNVRPGRLRRTALLAVVLYARFRTAYIDTRGTLVGIPSIHFAHWALIDEGRRLLFVSNYDGTWESYLGDFIDRTAGGLSAIWSNTVGFPRTRFLFGEGARDEQRFKTWVRAQQVPSNVWYAAYPSLSVLNVNEATAIRAGLSGNPSTEAIASWLQRL